ncbi:hypothetical protein B0O99DRAFT_680170 [Bisporella sp. PMI_857]|nr:hypothetical protein B0O99DRAFT_680170 [Bisporella sp. PMI_857]
MDTLFDVKSHDIEASLARYGQSGILLSRNLEVVAAVVILVLTLGYGFLSVSRSGKEEETTTNSSTEPVMEISQLWVYPIKSLRGCTVPAATIRKEGFVQDRKYILLDLSDPSTPKPMLISKQFNMCLFRTSLSATGTSFTVSYHPPNSPVATSKLELAFEPDVGNLDRFLVHLWGSSVNGYDMGPTVNAWFSTHFKLPVKLIYWGHSARLVLGNRPGRPASEVPAPKTLLSRAISRIPLLGPKLSPPEDVIAFNDVAPYLVVTEESLSDVQRRLGDGVGMEMEMEKFRPNIVVRSSLPAWDEDFWGEVKFVKDTRIMLTANCPRCVSITVNYVTGEAGTGPTKDVYKLLTKDRRVDTASKWSPVFGRYGFIDLKSEGREIGIGDELVVSRRNRERTVFAYPGMGSS